MTSRPATPASLRPSRMAWRTVASEQRVGPHASLLETVQDGVEDSRVGAESRPANWAHLDTDDVALFKERPPCLSPVRRAGEGGHPFLHHPPDWFGLVRTVGDRPWMFHADH